MNQGCSFADNLLGIGDCRITVWTTFELNETIVLLGRRWIERVWICRERTFQPLEYLPSMPVQRSQLRNRFDVPHHEVVDPCDCLLARSVGVELGCVDDPLVVLRVE